MSDPLFYGIVVKGSHELESRNLGEDEQYVSTSIDAIKSEIADLQQRDYEHWVASANAYKANLTRTDQPVPQWQKDVYDKYFTHYTPIEYTIVAITEVE